MIYLAGPAYKTSFLWPAPYHPNTSNRGAQEPFLGRESPTEQSGVTTRRHGHHRALHALLPATTAGLPSLAGLPSDNTNNAPPSPSNGSGGRSRRGKYPVIELYRWDPDGSTAADAAAGVVVGGCDDDNDDGLEGGRLAYGRRGGAGARRTAEQQATAVDHLRSVLGLASDQVDLMLESFPTLADVDADKLGLPAKLVSDIVCQRGRARYSGSSERIVICGTAVAEVQRWYFNRTKCSSRLVEQVQRWQKW